MYDMANSGFVTPTELMAKVDEGLGMLDDIKYTGDFMISTINRAQDFSKVAEGVKLVPKLETFDIKDILGRTLKLLGDAVAGKKDRVKILPLPFSLCSHIISDRQWIQENLLCLLSNASKFCPNGNITVNILLIPPMDSTTSEMVQFEVEDEGVGIPPEKKDHLFAAFRQAQKHAGGTGLGLYSLSQRVDALGGKYGVSDRRDNRSGSLFWFSVPYRPDITASKAAARRRSSMFNSMLKLATASMDGGDEESAYTGATPHSLKSTGIRILLADDSVFNLKMVGRMLHDVGFSNMEVSNGLEVMNALKVSGPFDVVIVDQNMPVMDGVETIRRVRAQEAQLAMKSPRGDESSGGQKHHQFMIGCSPNLDEATREEFMKAGADAMLGKPFSIDALQEILEKLGFVID